PLVASVHPHTAQRLREDGLKALSAEVRLLPPVGFFDFVRLERGAACVITDSGTVQEECSILRVPNVTIRDVTERPETVEAGANVLTGASPEALVGAIKLARSLGAAWEPPADYRPAHPSLAIAKIVLGYSATRSYST